MSTSKLNTIETSLSHQGGKESGAESDSDPSDPCSTPDFVIIRKIKKKHMFPHFIRANNLMAAEQYCLRGTQRQYLPKPQP